MDADTVLEMKSVSKLFFGNYVLKDVDFDLRRGEVHALLGENGAGKSTLIKILAGIYKKDGGEIFLDGKKVDITGIESADRHGIRYINQEICLAQNLTVAQNVYLAQEPLKKGTLVVDDKAQIEKTRVLLKRFGLELDPEQSVARLSIAQQQMVEIARALSKDARILIMDEPTSSLSSREVQALFEAIRNLKARGVAIIYISHRLDELSVIAERFTILRDGRKIGTYMLKDETPEKIASKMVGREIDDWYPEIRAKAGEEVLRVENLSSKQKVKGVSFALHGGEVLGLYGLLGTGRTETARMICGIDARAEGEIYVRGKRLPAKHPWEAVDSGVALVPEDRKGQGLILPRDADYNMTLAVLGRLFNGVSYDKGAAARLCAHYRDKLSIKADPKGNPVAYLSGGNQQKVILAKWLCAKPKALILDEPTRGIDVGTKKRIYDLIAELAEEGVGILLISSDLPEIVNLCSRVLIMRDGSVRAELKSDEIKQERVLALAMG